MLWENLEYTVIKNTDFHSELKENGFLIAGNVGPDALQKLRAIHQENHAFEVQQGGMFYSVYSLDISYRKRIYEQLDEVLNPIYQTYFQQFKSVLHSFIIKVKGEKSEFTLHQDSTGLDEFQFSPVSVWIPLQDTDISNGCLSVVPKSHRIKVPYRGISFSGPFQAIEPTVRQFLQPIPMKAGDILLFDNRILHYSPANHSTQDRKVVMSGIFPQNASIISCYQDTQLENAPIEIYEQAADFLLTGENFYHDCTIRPKTGEKITEVQPVNHVFSETEFLAFTRQVGIHPTSIEGLQNKELNMHIISEPTEKVKNSWFQKLTSIFN